MKYQIGLIKLSSHTGGQNNNQEIEMIKNMNSLVYKQYNRLLFCSDICILMLFNLYLYNYNCTFILYCIVLFITLFI